jgi:hypothetical protein
MAFEPGAKLFRHWANERAFIDALPKVFSILFAVGMFWRFYLDRSHA